MIILKKLFFSLFLLISLLYLFIIISPKIIKGFYPFGIKTAIVLTGSMEPTLEINDFVIMKKPNSIKLNDIVSYRQRNSNYDVLHRVIKINNNVIVTRGDANNTDDKPIDISQVTGVYVGKIKYIGNIIIFLQKPIILSSIIILLLLIMFIPSKQTLDNNDT